MVVQNSEQVQKEKELRGGGEDSREIEEIKQRQCNRDSSKKVTSKVNSRICSSLIATSDNYTPLN